MSADRAGTKVNEAIQQGYISPAMKEWATALCQQDEARFDSFIKKSTPQFAHLFKPSGTSALPPKSAGATAQITGSDQAEAVCQQLGLKPGTLESWILAVRNRSKARERERVPPAKRKAA